MYDYEYEYDILTVLRFLKYISLYFPQKLSGILEYFKEVDEENMMEDFCFYLWEVFDDFYSGLEEDSEIEVMVADDPLFARFCELTDKTNPGRGCLSTESAYRKLQDLAEYHITSITASVLKTEVNVTSAGINLMFWLSPDVYEPDSLVNALINFLLVLRRDVAAMEKMLEAKNTEIMEFPLDEKKEAA